MAALADYQRKSSFFGSKDHPHKIWCFTGPMIVVLSKCPVHHWHRESVLQREKQIMTIESRVWCVGVNGPY
jgi:hypothetical protein